MCCIGNNLLKYIHILSVLEREIKTNKKIIHAKKDRIKQNILTQIIKNNNKIFQKILLKIK